MPWVRCPYCLGRQELPDILLETTVRCRCGRFFDADPEPPPPELPPPPPPIAVSPPEAPPVPQLLAPHLCDQCHQAFLTVINRRRDTVLCSSCGRVTSVYATHFRCVCCRALLEAPVRLAGSSGTCPACGMELHVPRDVLEADSRRTSASDWFRFSCPGCHHVQHAPLAAVGWLAVCSHCRWPLEVPHAGYAVGVPHASPTQDPREATQQATTMRCSECGNEVPKRAAVCPYCGMQLV